MALRDDWAKTGKSFGTAFGELGKNVVRSVKTGVDKIDPDENQTVPESNVFNDGSWRETGKDIGGAFVNLGKSVFKSARTGIDKLDEKVENK